MWQAIIMLSASLVANSAAIDNENQLDPAEDVIVYMKLPQEVKITYLAGILDGV